MDVKRPVFRWKGSKWRIRKWLANLISELEFDVYAAHFAGAEAVLTALPPAPIEIINDLDGEVVNFWRVLRDRGDELRQVLLLTPYSREEYFESNEATDDPLEAARRFAIWTGQGYSPERGKGFATGACTSHRSASIWANYVDALPAIIERIRRVVLENREATRTIDIYDGKQTLHFCDPPYPGVSGYEARFDEHRGLLEQLIQVKGQVVLCSYANPLYDEMLAGWERYEKSNMARQPGSKRTEVVWIKKH